MKRRDLIKQFMSGLILPLVPASVHAAAIKTGRRLILIELSGANDGLNTIIPFRNDHYYKLRPNLAINASDRIMISNDFAKHQALSKLGNIWDRGELAIIHGLGYPGANRSHFKSIALWETGGDGTGAGRSGWLTEDIEDKLLPSLENGIRLDKGDLAKGKIKRLDRYKGRILWEVILTEGKNREVKRIFEALGAHVVSLHRHSFSGLNVRDIKVGKYRNLNSKIIQSLL